MKNVTVLFIIIVGMFCGCAKTVVREDSKDQQYKPSDKDAIRLMLERITEINHNSPESFTADFDVFGVSKGKKFRSLGNAQFDKKQGAVHFAFLDYIFRTPVTVFFMEGEAVRILFPIEKKMFEDDRKTINLANYTGFNINFDILYDLATGKIPLLRKYTIRKGLDAKSEAASLLILENDGFLETISFNKSVPDKILIINKNSGDKVEIYIKKSVAQGSCEFFQHLKIISIGTNLSLEIIYSRIQLNVPVKVKTIKDAKLPENLQIMKM